MENLISKVVILGGGTAGWMTATYLAKAFGERVQITLIEAETIPKIGVGEATIPNLQKVFFDFLGIPEEVWMRQCNASFKMGVRFVNWHRSPDDGRDQHFYHLFGLIPNCDGAPLTHYWLLRHHQEKDREPLAYACYKEAPLADANLSPRQADGTRVTHYAWHFDAHLVAAYLSKVGTEWGVRRVVDEVERVETRPTGGIEALCTRSGGRFEADLFIDCSGFRGLLINKALKEPFIDMKDYLLCDSAVAASISHDDGSCGIEPYTSAIAMRHGWTWKVPLLGRFGSGYVYSSNFTTPDRAAEEFLQLWGVKERDVRLNHLRFRTGRNRRAWVENCVSIGLASCSLEPLESTGIYFIYAAIYQLAKHFPDAAISPVLRENFNREIERMYDDSRDFIQAHYLFNGRTDTQFWHASRHGLKLSDSIRSKLELYKAGLAVGGSLGNSAQYYSDFETEFRNFWTNSNYYCVLSGMNCIPEAPLASIRYRSKSIDKAEKMFTELKLASRHLQAALPTCYEYLRGLHGDERDGWGSMHSPSVQVGSSAA